MSKKDSRKDEKLFIKCVQYEAKYNMLTTINETFPSKLEKSILQNAMQGKLVEQNQAEEPASQLIKRIKAEKEQLIKDKVIKKEKALPIITEDEIPFEIPSSWEWVRASTIMDVRDGTHDTPKYVTEGIPLVTSKNLKGGKLIFEPIKYISREDHELIETL